MEFKLAVCHAKSAKRYPFSIALHYRSFKSINLRRLFEVDDRNTKEQPTTKEEKHRQTPIQHGNKAGGQNSNLNCLNKTLDASFWAPNLLPYPGWQPSFMQVSGSMLYQHTHVPRFVLRMLGLEMKTFERGLGTVRTKHRHTPRFMYRTWINQCVPLFRGELTESYGIPPPCPTARCCIVGLRQSLVHQAFGAAFL